MTKNKAISFENSLEQLGQAVKQLESGELSLDEALKTFEQGVQLGSQCQTLLQKAEQKVDLLMDDGKTLAPFKPEEDSHA